MLAEGCVREMEDDFDQKLEVVSVEETNSDLGSVNEVKFVTKRVVIVFDFVQKLDVD